MDAEQAKWVKGERYPAQVHLPAKGTTEQSAHRDDVSDGRLAPAAGMIMGVLLGALFWGCVITAIIFLR